ncbi:MAG: DMT family transporter [Candidatus Aminicenantes bacterium]|nr:DMT family transporter [Candidatus Aminicenantes bacterium]
MPIDLIGKLFALSSAMLWAIAVIFFKKAGETIRPAALNLYKTVVAAVLLLPVFWITGEALIPANVTGNDWLIIAASGVLGITVADSLFFKCLNLMGAGLAAIVESMYSPMVMALSWMFLFNSLTVRQVVGAMLVIAAVLVASLKVNTAAVPTRNIVLGMLAGVGAMFFMGVGIILMKPVLAKTSVFWVSEVRLLAALITLLILILADKNRRQMLESLWQRRNWSHAFPGSILGTVLSMTFWVAAFKLTDVNSAAILNQTNTIFIVILASLWLKEPFTFRRVLAAILAFVGSALVLV